MEYRAHLQAFIDRWRYNANRAAQAQSKIKILEKLPELEVPETEEIEKFKSVRPCFIYCRSLTTSLSRFPETEKISPPLLQLNEVTFGYTPEKIVLKGVNIDVGLDSRIAIIGPNGAGKSTLCVVVDVSGGILWHRGLIQLQQDQVAHRRTRATGRSTEPERSA